MITNGSLVFILHRNTASFPSLGRSLTETGSSKISVPIGGGGGGGEMGDGGGVCPFEMYLDCIVTIGENFVSRDHADV